MTKFPQRAAGPDWLKLGWRAKRVKGNLGRANYLRALPGQRAAGPDWPDRHCEAKPRQSRGWIAALTPFARDDAGKAPAFKRREGFTLIEIIIAIVVIGIAVPAIMIPFSGIKDIKKPEDAVRAALLAQKQMEAISGKAYSEIPAAGSYTCAQFQTTLSVIDCANTEFDFNWTVENVTATAPNTAVGSPDFGKKVTLAVSRFDGAMSSLSFYSLF